MMTHICIKCGHVWINGSPSEDLSGGICDECITTYIRNRQRGRGYVPCFRSKGIMCPDRECTYFEACNKNTDRHSIEGIG